MKRRNFIKLSATASVIGLTPFEIQAAFKPLTPLFACPDISNRKIVLVNLAGGNDGLNTIIPLDQYDLYSKLRPTIKIKNSGSNPYIPLDSSLPSNQQVGLNPALTGFKSLYDQGFLRILNAVGYPSQNKSHFKSTDLYLTGNDGNGLLNGLDSGWMGRFMELYYKDKLADSYPLALEIGSNKTSLGFHGESEHGLSINITGQDPAGFYSILSGLGGAPPQNIPNTDYGTELKYINTTDALSNQYAESISKSFNEGSNTVTYPDTDIANQLKTVAKLISGDLETKVYMVRISGFDTHNSQVEGNGDVTGKHFKLLQRLSDAVESFMNDLKQQNLSEDIVGLTFSEFGRKAAENGNLGTDHGEIAPMFVFGEPIEGGVSGTNPDLSEAKKENNYQLKTFQHDYRQTFSTILQDYLGAPNSVIDAAFFNHTLNDSFTNLKVSNLLKKPFIISESCRNGIDDDVIDETAEDDKIFLISPNPFKHDINIISINDFETISYELFSVSGILIMANTESVTNNKLNLYLGSLSQGIYFIKIISNERNEVHRIFKI